VLVTGCDAAGVVEKVGEGVTLWKVGDEVMVAGSFLRQGSFAEYVVADERIVGKKPKKLTWEESASIPLCTLTAWEGIVDRFNFTIGKTQEEKKNLYGNKTLLVINGAGGVGSIASQIGKYVGLKVISTASRPETIEHCKSRGADFVINHRDPLLLQLEKLGFKGVDYVFNCMPVSEYIDQIVEIMNPMGHFCCIVNNKPVDTTKLASKSLSYHTERLSTRFMFDFEQEKLGQILNLAADLHDAGVFKHSLTKVFPFTLAGVKEALLLQGSGTALGKLAVTVQSK